MSGEGPYIEVLNISDPYNIQVVNRVKRLENGQLYSLFLQVNSQMTRMYTFYRGTLKIYDITDLLNIKMLSETFVGEVTLGNFVVLNSKPYAAIVQS